MATLLTGLNYFSIGDATTEYDLTMTDLNGNLFPQVVVRVNANHGSPTQINVPEFGSQVPLNAKLVVVLDTLNVDGVTIDALGGKINGRNQISFSSYAEPGSSITLSPVGDENWSALVGEYVD